MPRRNKAVPDADEMFINEYLISLNGTRAYMKVHKNVAYNTARVLAHKLLAKDNIQKEINQRLKAFHMSANEVLKLLADHARADIGDIVDDNGYIDVKLAKKLGLTYLLKEIEVTETSGEKSSTLKHKVKLHDPQKALELIGKYYALFTDKTENTEKKIIQVTIKKDE